MLLPIYRLLFIYLMVTTNQKSAIDTSTKKRKESKHNTKDSHEITREEDKRRRKELKRATKTINKMTISLYLSIITLIVNGLMLQSKAQSG